jgi:tRNA dimethylallyltransferase
MGKPKVVVIVGPTASGKSDLAVFIAKRLKGEVISADSRQVYKGLDIGTGKVTKVEMQGIKHHLLSVADPKKQFSASEFKTLAKTAIEQISGSGQLPIVVGGTGFYIDSLTEQINFPDVPPNELLRNRLNKLSNKKLMLMLQKKDPLRASRIDQNNKVRLIRALEIVESIGQVPPSPNNKLDPRFVFIGIKPDPLVLEQRIEIRLQKRFSGMRREAILLHSQGLTYKRMHELGLEYRYLALYLQGKISKSEMLDGLYRAIRQYAKRQITWFKRNKRIKWFSLSSTDGYTSKELNLILEYLKKKSVT